MTSRALKSTSKPDAIALLSVLQPAQAPAVPIAPAERGFEVTPATAKTGARTGTRQIAGHFPEATLKALKHIMAEENTTLQALLAEAIDDFLVKKGRSKLRQVSTGL